MFRFAHIEYLYLLAILPLILGIYIYVRHRYKSSMKLFADEAVRLQIMPEASWSKVRDKFWLLGVVATLLIFALACPQLGSKLKEFKQKGVEIVLAVDVSNSMLAEDFKPTRLERTKYALGRLLDRLQNDRIGMVVFAGDAFVQLPVTSDYASAKNFISHISPNMVQKQGTDLQKALETAKRSFSSQSDNSRVVILISDGEGHEGDPSAEVKALTDMGVVIHSIGIGTPEGAPISINGKMLKDDDDNMVVTKLDEELLKNIAVSSGGTYVRATNQSMGLDEIINRIRSMDEKEFSTMVFDEYDEQFYYLLAAALFVLLLEFVILERKNRFIARLRIFNKNSK